MIDEKHRHVSARSSIHERCALHTLFVFSLSLTPTHTFTHFTHFSVCVNVPSHPSTRWFGGDKEIRGWVAGASTPPQGSRRRRLASVTTAAAAAAAAAVTTTGSMWDRSSRRLSRRQRMRTACGLRTSVEDADDDDDGPLLEENLHDTGVAHCDGGPGDSDDELLLEPNVACSRVNAGDLDDDNQDRDEPTLELNIAPAKVCATVDKEANAKVAI